MPKGLLPPVNQMTAQLVAIMHTYYKGVDAQHKSCLLVVSAILQPMYHDQPTSRGPYIPPTPAIAINLDEDWVRWPQLALITSQTEGPHPCTNSWHQASSIIIFSYYSV